MTTDWVPPDGPYMAPLREEGWLMAPDRHRRDRPDHIARQLNQIDAEIDADLVIDKDTLRQVALARRAVREDLNRMERNIMGRLDSIDAALDEIGTGLDGVNTELAQLVTQIGGLSAGSVTDAEIAAVLDKAAGIKGRVGTLKSDVDAAIEPDAGEGEPPPSPEEPV